MLLSSVSSLLQVEIIICSEYLILHTLDVDAVIPVGSIFSPTIRFIMLDFPELVSPKIERKTTDFVFQLKGFQRVIRVKILISIPNSKCLKW